MTTTDGKPPLKLLAKLNIIFEAIDGLPKDGKNDFHGYKFASETAAKRALHPLFASNKVMLKTDVMHVEEVEKGKSKDGSPKSVTKITLAYTFIDCETGEQLAGQFMGYGEDSNDKGVWKAVTGCVKYILFNTFLIPTGDDPDQDDRPKVPRETSAPPARSTTKSAPAPKPPADPTKTENGNPKGTITEAQSKKIHAIINQEGWHEDDVNKWTLDQFGARISGLSVDQAAKVIDALEQKSLKNPPPAPAAPASAPADGAAPDCPECGKPMKKRKGTKGEFYGCSGYPTCKHTQPV